jgi:hypothetical protein
MILRVKIGKAKRKSHTCLLKQVLKNKGSKISNASARYYY